MSVSIPQDLVERIAIAMDSKSKDSVLKALDSLYEEINKALTKHRFLLISIIEGEHSQDRMAAIMAEIAVKSASLGYTPKSLQESYEDASEASDRMAICLERARAESMAFNSGIALLTQAANALRDFVEKM